MNIPLLSTYARWLHTGFPAGTVEPLPDVGEDGSTPVQGLYVVGDLKGIPLLKFSTDSGARALDTIADAKWFAERRKVLPGDKAVLDVVIVGAGVAGISAALRARKRGLSFVILESAAAFSTVANFPKGKPIYTYPKDFAPDSELATTGATRESLLAELEEQRRAADLPIREGFAVERVRKAGGLLEVVAMEGGEVVRGRAVVIAIGRSGNYRRLGVPGEQLDKVTNRLHDPKDYAGKGVLVVGGGDSALETAIAIAEAGGAVTISYRRAEFARPKPDNVEALTRLAAVGSLRLFMNSSVQRIDADNVVLKNNATSAVEDLPNDVVFAMLGREAPLAFLRRCGIPIRGDWGVLKIAALVAFLLFCVFVFDWKSGGLSAELFYAKRWFPYNLAALFGGWGGVFADPKTLLGTIAKSMHSPSFYYTFTYCSCVVIFGIDRMIRRRTPYVRLQTSVLMAIQCVPLFLLPEVILPYLGANGWFAEGALLEPLATALFPDGSYWRAYGLILAWPLMIYNVFTAEPMFWWLVVAFAQTFVLIPVLVYFYGKGAYCGWICSCGALAETLGDRHRHKMPHGKFWNRLNMVGQVILWLCFVLLAMRIASWIAIHNTKDADGVVNWEQVDKLPWILRSQDFLIDGKTYVEKKDANGGVITDSEGYPVMETHISYWTYKWTVDVFLAGILGVGLYFWFSGRTWCRFACPLAALMHIYARLGRFAIISNKKKCISCNVCTSVCHQGIDIMSFANKGLPMNDPQCVRCSACVQGCPTGVLQFGQVNGAGETIRLDKLAASPVLMKEKS